MSHLHGDNFKSLPCSAAIIAGGQSLRMGKDKALLEINGSRLIDRIAEKLRPWFREVAIVGSGLNDASMPLPVFPDVLERRSSLNGILSAMHHSTQDWVAVFSCDAPEPCPELIAHMMQQVTVSVDAIVTSNPQGHLEPFHAVWNRRAIPVLQAASDAGTLKLHSVIEEIPHTVFRPDIWQAFDQEGRFLINLNTPSELQAYCKNHEDTKDTKNSGK